MLRHTAIKSGLQVLMQHLPIRIQMAPQIPMMVTVTEHTLQVRHWVRGIHRVFTEEQHLVLLWLTSKSSQMAEEPIHKRVWQAFSG